MKKPLCNAKGSVENSTEPYFYADFFYACYVLSDIIRQSLVVNKLVLLVVPAVKLTNLSTNLL